MHDRFSFFINRASPIHRLSPLTKLTMVFGFIVLGFFGPGYWLPTFLFVAVLIPLSIIGRVPGEFLGTTVRLLLPAFSFLFIMQSLFYPGGHTVLFSFWVLAIKSEGVAFGYLTATRILVMVTAFLLLLLTTHPSTLMNDLSQRGAPSSITYIVTSTLQILPLMRVKAQTIIDAQRSRGLDTEGSFVKRVGALLPLVGPLVFGSLVDVEERAIAIEARAFNSPRPKTSLLEIIDTPAERVLRWAILVIVVLALVSRLWLS